MGANPEGTAEVESLARRLAGLEDRHRRLRLVTAGLGALLGAILILGQPGGAGRATVSADAAETIEARRFLLRDSAGKERATLVAEAGGPARLDLCDAEGHVRLSAEVAANGIAYLVIENGGSAKLGVGAEGSGFVVVRDKKGNQTFRGPE